MDEEWLMLTNNRSSYLRTCPFCDTVLDIEQDGPKLSRDDLSKLILEAHVLEELEQLTTFDNNNVRINATIHNNQECRLTCSLSSKRFRPC